jgi:hypothetical protein
MVTIDDVWAAKHTYKRIVYDNAALEKHQCDYLPSVIWQIVCGYACEDPNIVDFILRYPWGNRNNTVHQRPRVRDNNAYLEVKDIDVFKWEYALCISYSDPEWYENHPVGYDLYEQLLMLPRTQLDGTEATWSTDNDILELRQIIYKLYEFHRRL